jgi:hypothetical protein
VLERLVLEKADVVVRTSRPVPRPASASATGARGEEARDHRVHISGYGANGPYRDKRRTTS